ncbi:MAG TPA: uracil-DNA glycosylase [Tepidisphaeraceae bacterium]|nr:uracil-DNA glycosylase [Tepidisphaeraceae bacterium]
MKSERAMGLETVGPADWSELSIARPPARPEPVTRATAASPLTPHQTTPTQPAPVQAVAAPAIAPSPPASEPFLSPILSIEDRRLRLFAMDDGEVRGCTKCGLCHSRTHTVFGEGAVDARLMFIGEGPGHTEDQTGRPFVGPAGMLLDRMIGAMGLRREQAYIANVVKCRAHLPGPPAKDRAPAPEEVAACSPYLERQVEIIRPEVIVTLGVPASQFVLSTRLSMSRLRGNWHTWHGVAVMPTWHPSYLLRCEKEGNLEPKRQAWSDLQKVMAHLGLIPPKKSA